MAMKTEYHIEKIQPDPDGLDFAGLRKEGIRLAQELSGSLWTDYNLHDPGVTILEQVCYGLSDLAYRAGFDVADYLASPGGKIDYTALGLHRADEIFPCRPITVNDYRKLILDGVEYLDNAWVVAEGAGQDGFGGLYRIYLQLGEGAAHLEGSAKERVREIISANRNLCEDLADVEIVERIPYFLSGDIEIGGKREPAHILAEIYYECARYLSPKVLARPYAEMHRSGKSLEELFTGVLTGRGYITDDELHPWRAQYFIQELSGRIRRIEGVTGIRQLNFSDRNGDPCDATRLEHGHSYSSVACLQLPRGGGDPAVKLYRAGKACIVPQGEVEAEFGRLYRGHQTMESAGPAFDWLGNLLPQATPRNLGEYYPIQNHFPGVYGLNFNGLPDSAPKERKAQAMQLKAYLLFYEQIMANFLKNMEEIPRLLSADVGPGKSYFHQTLKNGDISGIEQVYRGGAQRQEEHYSALLASHDDYLDRKGRVLDYLLGLCGEKFSQHSLRQFLGEGAEAEEAMLKNKAAFLKGIVEGGRSRAAAFDYGKPPAHGNLAGLQWKLATLLGMRDSGGEIHIVEHILLRPAGSAFHEGHVAPDDFYSFRISILFPSGMGSDEFRKLAEETVRVNCPPHIQPEMFWLNSGMMELFRIRRHRWLEAQRSRSEAHAELNEAAGELISLLFEIRENGNG
jgi:hypothetical protein